MNRKYLICNQGKKNCSFRILDIQLDIFTCNFYKEYWRVFNDGNSFGAKSLLNRACDWIQKEEARSEFISKGASKETVEMLKSIEVGDSLFWTSQSKEVKLSEKPTEISQIARIKCEQLNGKIVKIPAYLLCKLSKGNYVGEYLIKGIENEKRAQEIEYKVRYYGFRAEIVEKDDGFLLKIYGDSQQEVDDFIALSLEQDFDISPYI